MMNAEFDYDLTRNQWDTLRALRVAMQEQVHFDRLVLEQLVALQLAEVLDDRPRLTTFGRKVLVRGSATLLDLA